MCHDMTRLQRELGPEGYEQTPLALSKTRISETERTKSGTPGAQNTPPDPDLAVIQDRWPGLPEHIKQAVLSLVRSSSNDG